MLYYRQKVLLALLEKFEGFLSKTELQKYLLIFTQRQNEKSFNFVPYHYGCYSFQANKDLEYLQEKNYLEKSKYWEIVDKKKRYVDLINNEDRKLLFNLHKQFKEINSNNLIKFVYKNYPYYTINSSIKNKILSEQEIQEINNIIKANFNLYSEEKTLFTIGYEGLSIEEYINKLIQNNIKVLVDVRKNPLSRKFGFSKSALKAFVEKFNIEYVHIPELGIETDKRTSLETLDDYNRLFEEYEIILDKKQNELSKIQNLINTKQRIALTCFEKDVRMCHRTRIKNKLEKISKKSYKITEL